MSKKYKSLEARNKSSKLNYERGRVGCYNHRYTEREIDIVMAHAMTDREISLETGHTVQSIQAKRHKVRYANER